MGIIMQIIVYLALASILCAIVARTGYNPLLAAIAFIPVANIFFILFLAVSKWPIEKELRELKLELMRLKQTKTLSPEQAA